MTAQSNVVSIPPKSRTVTYRKHKIIVTYVPNTGEWEWAVTHTRTLEFNSRAKDFNRAIKDAKKRIDTLLG